MYKINKRLSQKIKVKNCDLKFFWVISRFKLKINNNNNKNQLLFKINKLISCKNEISMFVILNGNQIGQKSTFHFESKKYRIKYLLLEIF